MHNAQNKALRKLLENYLHSFPESTLQDMYKLLYQGAMGPGHLLNNPESARHYLQQEWNSLFANTQELLTETITPDGKVFRIHLRPLKARLPNSNQLWQALFNSAQNWFGGIELFVERWQYMKKLITKGFLPFSLEEFTAVDDQAQQNNYPAMHHSSRYRDAYSPAYRIITKEEFFKMTL